MGAQCCQQHQAEKKDEILLYHPTLDGSHKSIQSPHFGGGQEINSSTNILQPNRNTESPKSSFPKVNSLEDQFKVVTYNNMHDHPELVLDEFEELSGDIDQVQSVGQSEKLIQTSNQALEDYDSDQSKHSSILKKELKFSQFRRMQTTQSKASKRVRFDSKPKHK